MLLQAMYKEKYGFTEPPKQLQDAFARVGIQYKVRNASSLLPLTHRYEPPHYARLFLMVSRVNVLPAVQSHVFILQSLDGLIGNTYDAHRMVAQAQVQGKFSQFKEALWRM